MSYKSLPVLSGEQNSAVIYPFIADKSVLLLDGGSNKVNYKLINPGESVVIPMEVMYKLAAGTITRDISFGVRTSLYQDPVNYKFTVVFKYDKSILDTVNNITLNSSPYNITL